MAEFKIDGRMKVKTLKENFQREFGGILHIKSGKKLADDDATLASIRSNEAAIGGELVCRASRTVGKFEQELWDTFGIKVNVFSPDDWVAVLDGITLNKIKDIPKNATKADMEYLVAYKRDSISSDKTATYGQYVISIEENGSVAVTIDGNIAENTKEALRTIASECGFEYDEKWNTRQLGKKLLEHILLSQSSERENNDDEDEDNDDENTTFTLERQLAAICLYMAGVDEEVTKDETGTFYFIAKNHPDLINYDDACMAWITESFAPSDIDEVVYSVTNTKHQKFLYFAATYVAFIDKNFSADEQHLLSLMAKIWDLGEFANETINKFKSTYTTTTIEDNWRDKYDTIIDREELSGFVVVKDEKFGFVDMDGNETISPRYSRVCDGIVNAYAVFYNGKWGFVDFSGQEIVSPQYDDYKVLDCELIAVEISDKWGVLNNEMNLIIPLEYNRIGEIAATNNDDSKWSIICAHKEGIIYNYDQEGNIMSEINTNNNSDN